MGCKALAAAALAAGPGLWLASELWEREVGGTAGDLLGESRPWSCKVVSTCFGTSPVRRGEWGQFVEEACNGSL